MVGRSDLTARDFEYSWKRVLNPAVASGSASDLWVFEKRQGSTTRARAPPPPTTGRQGAGRPHAGGSDRLLRAVVL